MYGTSWYTQSITHHHPLVGASRDHDIYIFFEMVQVPVCFLGTDDFFLFAYKYETDKHQLQKTCNLFACREVLQRYHLFRANIPFPCPS